MIKKTLQFLSILLILYQFSLLLADVNFAATKNEHLYAVQKQELSSTQDLNLLRQKAFHWLDVKHNSFKKQSDKAEREIYMFAGILVLQLGIITIDIKNDTTHNGCAEKAN